MEEVQQPSPDSEIGSGEEDGVEQTQLQQQKPNKCKQELNVLQFLDSTDDYLNLVDALSATLRQGWLELASARHSMGLSRVNTVLLDLKNHPAATSLRVTECNDGSVGRQPCINLRKWTCADSGECLEEEEYKEKCQRKSDSPQLRQRNISELSVDDTQEKSSMKNKDSLIIDDQVEKERSRTISTFGTLVSPKLRSAQISFEKALETVVEIANKRFAILSSYDLVKKGLGDTKA